MMSEFVKIKGEDAVDHVMGNELQEVGVAGRNTAIAIAWLCPGKADAFGQFGHQLVQGRAANPSIAADVTIGSAARKRSLAGISPTCNAENKLRGRSGGLVLPHHSCSGPGNG